MHIFSLLTHTKQLLSVTFFDATAGIGNLKVTENARTYRPEGLNRYLVIIQRQMCTHLFFEKLFYHYTRKGFEIFYSIFTDCDNFIADVIKFFFK